MGNTIPNKPTTNRCANHTVKYHQAACTMGRPLTIAKGLTLATGATECTPCRWGCNGAEEAWGNNTMLKGNAKNTTQCNAKQQRPQVQHLLLVVN